LTIQSNDNLESINFPVLESLAGSLNILENVNLEDINMQNLVTIGWNFIVALNPQVSNIDGFSSLTDIGGSLSLRELSESFVSLDGLQSIQNIGYLDLSYLTSLKCSNFTRTFFEKFGAGSCQPVFMCTEFAEFCDDQNNFILNQNLTLRNFEYQVKSINITEDGKLSVNEFSLLIIDENLVSQNEFEIIQGSVTVNANLTLSKNSQTVIDPSNSVLVVQGCARFEGDLILLSEPNEDFFQYQCLDVENSQFDSIKFGDCELDV